MNMWSPALHELMSREMERVGCGVIVRDHSPEYPKPQRAPNQPPTTRSRMFKNQRINDAILSAVQEHGVTVDEILGSSRKKRIVAARHAAIRAVAEAVDLRASCGNWTGGFWSTTAIGKLFGRDHTTILWVLGRLRPSRNQPKLRAAVTGQVGG